MRFQFVRVLCLAFLAGAAACGGGDELPEVDCTMPAVPTFAQVTAFTTSCGNCHSSELVGAARNGAPTGIDYDTYDSAVRFAEKAAEEVNEGAMPPGGAATALTAMEKETLFRWALCETPQ
jgi:uncharacterized membrane protein